MRTNVALFDSSEQEAKDFIKGLSDATGDRWEAKVCRSNQGRKNKMQNLKRYMLYFMFPFIIFLNRKKYNHIIGWQAFYGLVFAFYCRLFHVQKCNTLLIKNFIYKPKSGFVGKVYFAFMKFIVKSKYIDVFVCSSQRYCDRCAEMFDEPRERFVYVPFGINDFTKVVGQSEDQDCSFILALGRSNRDWEFLIDSLADTEHELYIVSDELKRQDLPSNITLFNHVWEEDSYRLIRDCKMMIIPILDGNIVAGETVLLQAMSFSKPIIITKPSCLAEDYVLHGETGLVITKDKNSLINAIEQLKTTSELYNHIAKNCRETFEGKYSLHSFGMRIGCLQMYQRKKTTNEL